MMYEFRSEEHEAFFERYFDLEKKDVENKVIAEQIFEKSASYRTYLFTPYCRFRLDDILPYRSNRNLHLRKEFSRYRRRIFECRGASRRIAPASVHYNLCARLHSAAENALRKGARPFPEAYGDKACIRNSNFLDLRCIYGR